MQVFEGNFHPDAKARFAIVASRFNHLVVDRLVEGAVDALQRHGIDGARIDLVRVPGAWELPLVAGRLARSHRYAAIIALGAVIRGATPHFDYVAAAAAQGLAAVAKDSGVPVTFGVLTTETIEQALERSGTKAGNKGWDASLAALELASLQEELTRQGL